MSGSNLPYHLRVKKDIERRLFIEQLRLVAKVYDLEAYAYVGMAGAFSEDFKLMKDRFNFKDFFSYEIDEKAYKRQKFNLPFSETCYENKSIGQFILDYPELEIDDKVVTIGKSVLWLDYIGFEEKLLQEFSDAIAKLEIGSVIKITLNAHAAKLVDGGGIEKQKERVEKVKNLLGKNYFFDDIFEHQEMTNNKFPLAIYKLLKRISVSALRGTNNLFLPLSSYIYQDGMKMITFTGIKIEESEKENFLSKTGLDTWEYGLNHTDKPINIEVPFLSLKEKYTLDACFPGSPGSELRYFEEEEIKSYERFHRFYPTFVKMF